MMKIDKEQKRGLDVPGEKHYAETGDNIKKLEQEKQKLYTMLENTRKDDSLSRNALTTAIKLLDKTIKQIQSVEGFVSELIGQED